MEYNFSKNQIQEFLNNPVWLFFIQEIKEAIEEGRSKLEKAIPTEVAEIAAIQGGLARLREVLNKPNFYLEEFKLEEEKNAD